MAKCVDEHDMNLSRCDKHQFAMPARVDVATLEMVMSSGTRQLTSMFQSRLESNVIASLKTKSSGELRADSITYNFQRGKCITPQVSLTCMGCTIRTSRAEPPFASRSTDTPKRVDTRIHARDSVVAHAGDRLERASIGSDFNGDPLELN